MTKGIASSLSLFSLYLLSLTVVLSTAAVNIALFTIVFSAVLAWPSMWYDFRRNSLFWLTLALTLYTITHSLISVYYHPSLAESSNPHWSHIARVTGILSLFIGWWIAYHRRHVPYLLMTLLAGLAIGLFAGIDLSALLNGSAVHRGTWGTPTNEVGYLSAVGFVGCFIGITQVILFGSKRLSTLALIIGLTATLFFFTVLLGSGTRGAWLAATIVLVSYIALLFIRLNKHHPRHTKRYALVTVFLMTALVPILYASSSSLENRLDSTWKIAKGVSEFDVKDINAADPSSGARIMMWQEGIKAIADRPLRGWGLGGKHLVAEQDGSNLKNHPHFHNLYIEIAVGLGLPGFILFILVYGKTIVTFMKKEKTNYEDFTPALLSATLALSLLVMFLSFVLAKPQEERSLFCL
ncbi:hypothetical protein CAI21_07930 [Alkalilimnicola ehrlichii]|uniref:O-antigen ligase family protein n=1 Tax=Alkalilimnicola ehrlichii TaxID=351052 RepID=UPI000E2E7981|nr:O-antigen ligase family protein [Alkalilimnicola ehrlichii]RFA30119.1 hypothetical protein CAI21_07930 [Alkalilimnicola ehrlichii]